MEGIAGIISKPNSSDDVGCYAKTLSSALNLRNPSQVAPGNGLKSSHVRLIGDAQQFSSDAVVLHGNIHNSNSVAKKLGVETDSVSLLELIYIAFRAWGPECAKEFLGDFVFCIWNSPDETLFCFRDALGVRPLYYVSAGQRIAFSTNFNALRKLDWVSSEIDKTNVAYFLQGSMNDRQGTALKAIKRVPAASSVQIGLKHPPQVRQYWRFSDIKPLEKRSSDEYIAGFKRLFEEAVRCRLPSSSPVAAELSGGLDSSSVFAVARSISSSSVKPYSAVFPEHSECDESTYIDAVAARYSAASRKISADGSGFLDLFTESIETFGGLHNAANIHITLRILNAAKSDGFSSVLNGVDGDNVVSHGRSRLFEIARNGNWLSFSRNVKAVAPCFSAYSENPARMLAQQFGLPAISGSIEDGNFIKALLGALVLRMCFGIHTNSSPRKMLSQFRAKRSRSAADASKVRMWRGRFEKDWFPQEFIDESRLDTPGFWSEFGHTHSTHEERDFHIASLNSGINQHYFEYIHAISSAYGIENLSPFMDRRLVEFCIGLPASAKLSQGYTRAILRRAMKGYLPDLLLQRRVKANLGAASIAGFRRECLPWLLDFCRSDADLLAPFMQVELARDLARHVANDEGVKPTKLKQLWIIFCLARWLWIFKD